MKSILKHFKVSDIRELAKNKEFKKFISDVGIDNGDTISHYYTTNNELILLGISAYTFSCDDECGMYIHKATIIHKTS